MINSFSPPLGGKGFLDPKSKDMIKGLGIIVVLLMIEKNIVTTNQKSKLKDHDQSGWETKGCNFQVLKRH